MQKTATDIFTKARILELVSNVLRKRFPGDSQRQYIYEKSDRLNFCCPYCGDSLDPEKKRGNLYTNGLYFKCYNGGCDKYTNLEWFLRNFNCDDELSTDELTELNIYIQEERKNSEFQSTSYKEANLQKMVDAQWDKLLIPRSELMSKLRLWDIYDTSPQGVYLSKRLQKVDNKFAWDNYRKRLFIFNLDATGEWVFGLQVMPMDGKPTTNKYKTYNIEKCWEYFMKNDSPAKLDYVSKYNKISMLFGILRINMHRMITIFEGPMDHFLYPNSVATCGTGHEFPLSLDNKRYLQDNDKAGLKLAVELIEQGEQVFMWKKLFEDKPELYGNKRKDYNDIYINGTLRGLNIGTLDEYFTTHKYDTIFI